MNFQPTFWLIGLAALFALPLAQSHCNGQATAQTTATTASVQSPMIHVSTHAAGITITGVN